MGPEGKVMGARRFVRRASTAHSRELRMSGPSYGTGVRATNPRGSGSPSAGSSAPVTSCTFDCYGTLIDWKAGIERHLGDLLRSEGYSGNDPIYWLYVELERREEREYAPYRAILARTATQVGERLGIRISAQQAREFAASLPEWPPFADTIGVLRELGRRGIRRVILSNIDRDLLQETIRRSGLEVDGSVTAEDVHSYKPAPGHWLRFLRDFSADRASTLHVAHGLVHDIVTAQRLGFRTVWVDRYAEDRSPEIRPTYVTKDLRGLLDLVGP